ncbi:MAG: hypothetical protein HC880_02600 [Bacteroidia bacterium]|nr:hypothetical protein [Bacteroidia bacterium]
MNRANYFLTKDGVISKLDTYWDKLKDLTVQLENLSRPTVQKMFNIYLGSILFTVVILWLELEKNLSITLLALVALGGASLVARQILSFLEFVDLRKKGRVIHDELSHEIEYGYSDEIEEDISVEERILLSNFLLACDFPINQYLYLGLLILLPMLNLGLLLFCYLW